MSPQRTNSTVPRLRSLSSPGRHTHRAPKLVGAGCKPSAFQRPRFRSSWSYSKSTCPRGTPLELPAAHQRRNGSLVRNGKKVKKRKFRAKRRSPAPQGVSTFRQQPALSPRPSKEGTHDVHPPTCRGHH